MIRSLLFAGAVALAAAGCASSNKTERSAESHEQRARQAAAYGEYDRAAAEKHEADRLHEKAARERIEEDEAPAIPPAPPPAPMAP